VFPATAGSEDASSIRDLRAAGFSSSRATLASLLRSSAFCHASYLPLIRGLKTSNRSSAAMKFFRKALRAFRFSGCCASGCVWNFSDTSVPYRIKRR
jgi:hypothetical protein